MEETQGGRQAEGVTTPEVMASPSHPIHLYERHPCLDTDSSGSSLSSTHEVLTAAAYANFVHIDVASVSEDLLPSPAGILFVASASNNFNNELDSMNLSSHAEATEPLLRRELDYKSLTSELLMGITSPVQEHGPSGMSTLSDGRDEEEAQPRRVNELPDELRTAICDHPMYPEMALAHIAILKIGAPRELHVKLDDVTKKFQRSREGAYTSKLGQDPELDHFMKSYAAVLKSFRENLEEPFKQFTQFLNKTTKDLEGLCGHYVETKPEEEGNFGFDIGPRDRDGGALDSDDDSSDSENYTTIMTPPAGEEESLLVPPCPADIDESIVVDPEASEEELKRALKRKYGRHIGALKAEFNRVQKKGKLPDAARRILKDWFNQHAHWPYPSEMEKIHLQRLCNLTLKQVNNWFINERKRHWNSEERSMHPNPEFKDDNAPREGAGLLEQL